MFVFILEYNTVFTIFDNDDAGKAAVEKYKEKYGINGFVLDMEKDVSDSIESYGQQAVIDNLEPKLIECIYTCRRCPENSTLE